MATTGIGIPIPGMLNNGAAFGLSYFTNNASPSNLILHLFDNNHTPASGDTTGSFTEPFDPSYAPITLNGASWTISGNPAVATYPIQTFTFTGGADTIYGIYYTRASDGLLVDAKLFPDGPYAIVRSGDTITVTPRFQ